MLEMIEMLSQEHHKIEGLLRVLERELSVFDRGERPDYEVVLAVIVLRGLSRYMSSSEGGHDR